ncbi:MAG: SprT-like domain-containing protein [Flavobacteriaceae bacterium]|nr:SprT-like domain-containing protein [Flavobacteriaceae bacterium]MBL6683952.1 SprT-like domain-containing protein [Flavobacteriaceae bacterium]
MISNLEEFLPVNSINYVSSLIEKENIQFKVVKQRRSKHGDFKRTINGDYIITINRFYNQYRFILTLIHELAHYFVTIKYYKAKPHGKLWKNKFKQLLNPLLDKSVFPNDLLKCLSIHMKNPKSTFSYDLELSKVLDKYDNSRQKYFYLDQVKDGEIFFYGDGNKFLKIKKRRKRYLCENLINKKKYLFLGNTKIKIDENSSN